MLEASSVTEVFQGLHPIASAAPEEACSLWRQSFGFWTGTVRHHTPAYCLCPVACRHSPGTCRHQPPTVPATVPLPARPATGPPGTGVMGNIPSSHGTGSNTRICADIPFIQTPRESVQVMESWNSLGNGAACTTEPACRRQERNSGRSCARRQPGQWPSVPSGVTLSVGETGLLAHSLSRICRPHCRPQDVFTSRVLPVSNRCRPVGTIPRFQGQAAG